MPLAFKTGVVTFILAASLTVLKAKVAGPHEPSITREHLGSVENKTTTSAETTTAPEAKNDTRSVELSPDSRSLRDDSAPSAKSASGWNTVYKLLYETFSYPEAKELDVLLPLPTSYLTVKPRGDQEEYRKQASRQLTYRTVSGDKREDNGSGKQSGNRQKYDEDGSSGSSSSGSSGESEQFEDEDDDEAEAAADAVPDAMPKPAGTTPSTPSPSSKPHRRLARAAPGSKLPPLSRSWREHGRDFGLPVREDRWLKHVSAKRREAQLIQRDLRNQLRAHARQWRQREGNRFHQRYMPAAQGNR